MEKNSTSCRKAQSAKILTLLREAGQRGVSKKYLIFELGFTQAGARVFELERLGHKILHEKRPGEHFVTFVLLNDLPLFANSPASEIELKP